MSRFQRWPWVTPILSILVMIGPFGQEVIHSAFYSGESISRDIGTFLMYCIAGITLVAIAVEWLIRWWWAKRRRA
jgi:hypothetical protein